MKTIMEALGANLTLLATSPAQLVIVAHGHVNTGGWSRGTLSPRFTLVPPADGLMEFDFLAEPPSGPSIQVIRPIVATCTLTPPPPWLRGARIIAATNHIEVRLDPKIAVTENWASPAVVLAPTKNCAITLSMRLDAHVSFQEAAVWLEGYPVTDWMPKAPGLYGRIFPVFPVSGLLDVEAKVRSMVLPNVPDALVLSVAIAGAASHIMRVDTVNYLGREKEAYDV